MSFTAMKHITATWLVEMATFLSDNPQFVVNEFRCAGILAALDNTDDGDTEEFTDDTELLSDEDENIKLLAETTNFLSEDEDTDSRIQEIISDSD